VFVKLCFYLHFIPLDPDTRTQMNADPTGSGSTSLHLDIEIKKIVHKSLLVYIRLWHEQKNINLDNILVLPGCFIMILHVIKLH